MNIWQIGHTVWFGFVLLLAINCPDELPLRILTAALGVQLYAVMMIFDSKKSKKLIAPENRSTATSPTVGKEDL